MLHMLIFGVVRYKDYYEAFRAMFPVAANTTVYYVPGNNDVGYGSLYHLFAS